MLKMAKMLVYRKLEYLRVRDLATLGLFEWDSADTATYHETCPVEPCINCFSFGRSRVLNAALLNRRHRPMMGSGLSADTLCCTAITTSGTQIASHPRC